MSGVGLRRRPDPAALMLARGSVALADSADASRCYPDLWRSPAAARQAFHRARRVTAPGVDDAAGDRHAPLRRATYQRTGAGKRPASLVFDPAMVPPGELQAWLEERIGPLARLEVEPPRDPPSPEPPGRSQAPAEGAPAPMPAADGSAGAQAATGGDPGPLGEVLHHPQAVPAAPAPSTELRDALAAQLLGQRLELAALAQRLREARPKRTYNVRALDWAAMEDVARSAAELPTTAWRTWREEAGPEGVVPPQAAGSAVVENAYR